MNRIEYLIKMYKNESYTARYDKSTVNIFLLALIFIFSFGFYIVLFIFHYDYYYQSFENYY